MTSPPHFSWGRWIASSGLAITLGSVAIAVVGIGTLLPAPAHAQLRDVLIRFMPPAVAVDGYRIFVFDQQALSEDEIDPGFIPPDADGVARVYLPLDASRSYLVEMTAYNAAGESGRSNALAIAAESCDASACDDGNPCTIDSCDAAGCLSDFEVDGTRCDDGFVDTINDVCTAGTCAGETLVCSADTDCGDGDVCNGIESCEGGLQCLAGEPLDCGAPTQCTIPRCDPALGCQIEIVLDGTPCDDGLAQTSGDVCMGGSCSGTEDVADEVTLFVDRVSPESVTPGSHTLTVSGGGFTAKPKVLFENGEGRKPRIRFVNVIDESTLEVGIKARRRGLKRPTAWDLRLKLPDGQQVVLPAALMVTPE